MTKAAVVLTPESVVRRAPGVVMKEHQGTMLLAAGEGQQGHCMDPVGHRIWACLAEPRSLAELCAQLSEEYAVEPRVCVRETTAFISELVDKGLIESDRS